jgi:hypothetical protein
MPSSKITADTSGQIYWVRDRSVGGSRVIFGAPVTSASTIPDSLGARTLPYSSPSLPFMAKISTPGLASQSEGSPLGTMTTRRASPSPLLSVVTSRWSASARWMTLRSKGVIGSMAKGLPVRLTCSAMRQASA